MLSEKAALSFTSYNPMGFPALQPSPRRPSLPVYLNTARHTTATQVDALLLRPPCGAGTRDLDEQ